MSTYDNDADDNLGGNPTPQMHKAQTNLDHLNPGKCKDKAGVSGGLSDLQPLNDLAMSPDESTNSSAPWHSTRRITKNPTRQDAKKNGKSFEID